MKCQNVITAKNEYETYKEKLREGCLKGWLSSEEYERLLLEKKASLGLLTVSERPLPDGVADPHKHCAHLYHNCALIRVDFPAAVTRSELLRKAQAGEEIRIVSDRGLAAVLKNASLSEKGDCITGEGSIEGYTAAVRTGNPEVMVFFNNEGLVAALGYREFPEDLEAHLDYPLWMEYYKAAGNDSAFS